MTLAPTARPRVRVARPANGRQPLLIAAAGLALLGAYLWWRHNQQGGGTDASLSAPVVMTLPDTGGGGGGGSGGGVQAGPVPSPVSTLTTPLPGGVGPVVSATRRRPPPPTHTGGTIHYSK